MQTEAVSHRLPGSILVAKTPISSRLPSSPSEDTLVLPRYQRPWGLATTPCLISLAHVELCATQQNIKSIYKTAMYHPSPSRSILEVQNEQLSIHIRKLNGWLT